MARASIKSTSAGILAGVTDAVGGAATAGTDTAGLEGVLKAVLAKLSAEGLLRPGLIAIRTRAAPDHGLALRTDASGTTIVHGPQREEPLIEIIGDSDRIGAVVSGQRDARKTFLLGGMRVRGDLAYLSELGMKLGLFDRPIL
jgi:hypothetical protein